MRTERVELESANGMRLAGEIDWPEAAPPLPAVVFSHGWGSGKCSPRNLVIAQRLAEAGLAALRFDFTGHGDSSGTEADSTWAQQVADLGAAVDFMLARPEVTRVGVAGASTGGLVALRLAARHEGVSALVLREPRSEGAESYAHLILAPTLLLQGGRASPLRSDILRLAGLLRCPHRLVEIEGGGHLFEDPATFEVVVEQTVDWFAEHLRQP